MEPIAPFPFIVSSKWLEILDISGTFRSPLPSKLLASFDFFIKHMDILMPPKRSWWLRLLKRFFSGGRDQIHTIQKVPIRKVVWSVETCWDSMVETCLTTHDSIVETPQNVTPKKHLLSALTQTQRTSIQKICTKSATFWRNFTTMAQPVRVCIFSLQKTYVATQLRKLINYS